MMIDLLKKNKGGTMYIIREDKDGGKIEVGYYLPDGSFYSE